MATVLLLTYGTVLSQNKPNIVLLYADDLGWADLAVQGSDFYETPNIDKLAEKGIRFTNAYANAANCAPSRASLITGLYSPRHGIYTVGSSKRGKSANRKLVPTKNTETLEPSLQTIPRLLKEQGYATCMAGKWHLSEDPRIYGFDTNFGGNHSGHPKSYFSPYKNPNLPDGPEGEHLPDRLSTDVCNWMEGVKDQPFFLYFPFYSVHTPTKGRPDLIEKYEDKEGGDNHNHPVYAAMIEAMDLAVGKVVEKIEAMGLSENTLIIFTSDNGNFGGTSIARPLRGSKGMYYEGGVRVPFIASWEGRISEGAVSDLPIMGTDLFPTFAYLSGKKKGSYKSDGENLYFAFTGEQTSIERSLYWHFPAYLQMYKKDRAFEDAHDKPYWRSTPCSVIRSGDWKLIEYFETNESELFNLAEDIGETNDLSQANPNKKIELLNQLVAWRMQVKAPVPRKLNPEYKE